MQPDIVRCLLQYTRRELVVVLENTGFLSSAILNSRGGCVDLVILELVRGHTLLGVVMVDPTSVDLVTRVAIVP